jgi:predicted amidohydrolase YtcJ
MSGGGTARRAVRIFCRVSLSATLLGLALAVSSLSRAAESAVAADAVFVNAKVFTADPHAPMAEAFAVKGERFLAVGTSATIRGYVGPNTVITDLHGRLVTPGLADGHFHNEGGGPNLDLSKTRSLGDLFAAVGKAARAAGAGAIIVSNPDWHEAQLKEKRLPLARELDAAAPDNPVVLVRGGHEMILNGAALRKWNITTDMRSPAGGNIGKEADGTLSGELVDNAKKLVELPLAAPVSAEDAIRTQRTLNQYGITSVRIPGAYKGNLFEDLKLLKAMRDRGELTLRYTVYLPGFGTGDPAKIRDMIVSSGLKQDEGDDWVRVGGMKLLIDGGFEGGHMREPYEEPYGKGGTFTGITVVPTENFVAVVKEVNRLGWRIATHAVGDAALDEVLDAYEAADAERSIKGQRWSVEHAFIARPDQIARMKKLDLILSVQDHLYLAAPAMKKYWGADRARSVTPLKTYLANGFLIVGGTDSPVVPFNPFWEIYHFNTRDTISDGVYGPEERVRSRATLLRLITLNYAKAIGEAAIKGSIEPGKLADFAVLSSDILSVPAHRLLTTKALATYVGGREVYRDPSFR